ncbi:MAG: GIY-YIG nuclease family protein [Gammaproteobacteria bacterium]|nr:GIY-YIG nuclease family protein [Gammaproteobacteria bacterium]
MWILYLLECESGAYYTGITTDLERRFNEHLAGVGARYTRANPPTRVMAIQQYLTRSEASRAEAYVKRLPKKISWAHFTI